MKYKLQVHCAVPSFVVLTPDKMRFFERNNLIANGFQEMLFENESALFHHVRGFDYINYNGVRKNHLLDATMTHVNDSRRHRHQFERGIHEYFYLGYLIKDGKGRTIDLRHYEDELYTFDNESYANLLQMEHRRKELEKEAHSDFLWERYKRLVERKIYWGYFRRFRTTQERRYACDAEHKPFIRQRRSAKNLPSAWDDFNLPREKTWKARTKTKFQWQVHLSVHIDTVWHEKRTYDEDLLTDEIID